MPQNYKTFLKEIKADLNKWKAILCSWIGRFDIVNMAKILKGIYKCRMILIKIPTAVFSRNWQVDPKTFRKFQGTLHSQNNH